MAARQASFRGNTYHCACETTPDIGYLDAVENDSDFYPVLQHLMPGWLDLATRAKRALEYNPIVDTDPISLSNAAFTRLVVAATIAWVQDAVLLTEDIPELFSRAPFSYLLHPDIMTYWNNVKDRVKKSVEEGDKVHHEANLERHDVLNYIRSCNISSTNRLVNEVPSRTCNLMLQQQQNLQQREIDFHLQEISRIAGRTIGREVLGDRNSDGAPNNVEHECTTGMTEQTPTELPIPYCLKTNAEHNNDLLRMVQEWEDEVRPREVQSATWWEVNNKAQKTLREKRKLLYICMEAEAKMQPGRTILEVTAQFQDLVHEIGGCWSDVETILRRWKQTNGGICPWNRVDLQHVVNERKTKQADKANKRKLDALAST